MTPYERLLPLAPAAVRAMARRYGTESLITYFRILALHGPEVAAAHLRRDWAKCQRLLRRKGPMRRKLAAIPTMGPPITQLHWPMSPPITGSVTPCEPRR